MKIGILSFAHMHAYSYAEALRQIQGVALTVVADDDESRGQAAARKYNVPYVRDYQEALRMDLDGVIVCSENARHAEMVIAAADAGKHVLCEKPIATRVADAKRMVDACDKRGVKLQTAFPMRYNTPIQHVKRQIEAGEVGPILAMNGTNRGQNPGGWFVNNALSGGGAVLDHTVHVIDIMRWYTGSEVREVYAEIDTRFGDTPTDDCGLLTLEFENGVIAAHDPSWSRPKTFPTWGDVTLKVIGTKGVVRVDAFAQHSTWYNDESGKVRNLSWGDNPDLRLVQGFVDSIRLDKQPLVTGWDGLRAMEVALAAYASAAAKKPVRLDTLH